MTTIKERIKFLSPSYFALVMATGIVSSASCMQHYTAIGNLLFWLNNIFFVILLILFVTRLFFFFFGLLADLTSHEKGVGFLTLVAGSCILGTAYAQIKGAYVPAAALWYFGIIMWLIIIYSFLSSVILKKEKPSPETSLNGSWFLLVVSTQSISILGGILASHIPWSVAAMLFISLATFLLGLILYLVFVPLIMFRLLFYPMKPEEVVPSYWINMGAAAITTLAGIMLSQSIKMNSQFASFYPFVHAVSLLFWCMALFWIPLIFIMEFWRYAVNHSTLKYTPSFWSLVFPLGMFTASTWSLAESTGFPFLRLLSEGFIFVAWAAWLITFLGLLLHLLKTLHKPQPDHQTLPSP